MKRKHWLTVFCMAASIMAFLLAGCSDGDDDGGAVVDQVSDYGGSIPRGDYVTADIDGQQITIQNKTFGTETTLPFGDIPDEIDVGTSILQMSDPDNDGNYYLIARVEGRVLALHKMSSDLTPIVEELPFYMFEKTKLASAALEGKSFNYMELYSDAASSLTVEVGIVGFDTDPSGRLYGAAYDSGQDLIYSITDEDGRPDSGDEFSLARTEGQADGSLVLWEGAAGDWNTATTLTGSDSGPIVLDHGPGAGGGAGFAFPQVAEADPDAFWDRVAGRYFMIAYYYDGNVTTAEYFRCEVEQKTPGDWNGSLSLYSPQAPAGSAPLVTIDSIVPLSDGIVSEIEGKANFSQAQSQAVQNAGAGRGLFQQAGDDPDFMVAFDPEGNYLLGVKTGGPVAAGFEWVTGFGFGIRDANWQPPTERNT